MKAAKCRSACRSAAGVFLKVQLRAAIICLACTSASYAGGPTGYAAMDGSGSQYLAGGTTGGAGGTVVTVTNYSDLSYYAGLTAPYIIQVKGQIIAPSNGNMTVKGNKTIIGIGNDAAIIAHGMSMNTVSNIIIKNLTIKDNYMMGDWPGKANDWDGIALRNTHHVWIDHCHLSRVGDGLLDMSYATGYVTVSYTIFSHQNKTTYADGLKTSPFTTGLYTYEHCWFYNTTQRNITSTNANLHAFNCFHWGIQSYCMSARDDDTYGIPTHMLLENMYFKQSDDPYLEEGGYIQANGNILDGCTGSTSAGGTSYTPPYSYTLDSTSNVPDIVMAEAGPGGYANTATEPAIFINFRPSSATVVRGYLSDYGSSYGNRGDGLYYGWSSFNDSSYWRRTISTKDETSLVPVDSDFRRNAIITTLDRTNYWEIGLDNGLYYVHLMCGDPGDPRELFPDNNVYRNNTMDIEGTIVTDPDGAELWDYDEYYVVANVTDGRLTISQAPAGEDSALCFVDIIPAKEPENPSDTVGGLDYKYYEGTWSFAADFDSLTPVEEGAAMNFDISETESEDGFGFVFEGYIDIPTSGMYTFYTNSNDGSRLYIGSTEVVDNDGLHDMQEASGEILLNEGKHAIRVEMFDGSGDEGLEVRWEGPGISKQVIPNSRLYRTGIYGDFTGDDVVDVTDLGEFVEYWLENDCNEIGSLDLNEDCIINFHELAAMGQNWL